MEILRDDVLRFLTRWRFRWARGLNWTTIPMTFFSLVSLSLIWRDILNRYSFPVHVFVLIVGGVFTIVTLMIGYFDEKRKMIKFENEHVNITSNIYHESFIKMFEDIDEIKREISAIKSTIHSASYDAATQRE